MGWLHVHALIKLVDRFSHEHSQAIVNDKHLVFSLNKVCGSDTHTVECMYTVCFDGSAGPVTDN